LNLKLTVLFSVIAGLVIALLTGLVNVTPQHLVGATWHGWPLPWFYVIVYLGSPIDISWLNLAGDIVVWFVVALIVGLLISKFKKTSSA